MHNKIKKLKKQSNPYLIVGIIMTLILIIIAIFGDYLAPYDVNNPEKMMVDPETNQISFAPFSPSLQHLLGTDDRGADLLSMLLVGAKYTLVVVLVISISRIIIALPLGLIAGWWPKYIKSPLSSLNRVWSSMPVFLIVVIILAPIYRFPTTKNLQLLIVWLVLTLVGIIPIAENIRGHVENIKRFEFMDGVKVLGGGFFYTIRKHIFPHLKVHLTIIFAMELASILWLLGQLGIVYIFVGGTLVLTIDDGIYHYYSTTNEWAGLLGGGRHVIRNTPWLFYGPALAFAYGILSFQFLAEGLRKRFNKDRMEYDF